MCRELDALRQSISEYAEKFDANSLLPSQAGEVAKICARMEASLSAIKVLAAARAAESGTWKQLGYRSAAEHIAHDTGMSPGRAKRALETGQRMNDQPDVANAALAGKLSPEQAEAVSDGAAANPSRVRDLIEKAQDLTIPELNEEVARAKAEVTDLEERRRNLHNRRFLRRWTDREGAFHAHLYGNPESGIGLSKVIDPIRQRLVLLRRNSDQPRESFEALEHDAVLLLAAIAAGQDGELGMGDLLDLGLFPQLDHNLLQHLSPTQPDDTGSASSESAGSAKSATKGRRKLAGPLTKVIVRVNLEALLRGFPIEGELCEIKGFGPVPVSLVEDLIATGNTFLAAVLTDGREVKGVYHHRRRPNAHQKTALEMIYPECAVKGCNARGGLEHDHREDWSKTHFTVLDLLDSLCHYHHDMKTRLGWALVEGRGKREFVPPKDPRHPQNQSNAGTDPAPGMAACPPDRDDTPHAETANQAAEDASGRGQGIAPRGVV